MAKISLPDVGSVHVMVVRECRTNRGKFGDEVIFTDANGDTIYLNKATADRQLQRIFGENWSYADAVGNALHFSRVPNTKTPGAAPYWNIRPAEPGEAHVKTSVRLAGPSTDDASVPTLAENESQKRKAIVEAYLALYQHMRKALPQESAEAVQAATATVWITWDKRGIQPDGRGTKPTAAASTAPAVPTTPPPSGKRLSPPEAHDFSKVPPPTDADFVDDLPF